MPRYTGKSGGFSDILLEEMALVVLLPFRESPFRNHRGIVDIQTVDIIDLISTFPQQRRDIEKPQRFGPKVKRGKIVNPRINEQDGCILFHVKHFISRCKTG